jgi:hypothetical protein
VVVVVLSVKITSDVGGQASAGSLLPPPQAPMTSAIATHPAPRFLVAC